MARKPIPEDTQNHILLRSRRRCCLCFWLEGRDEVLKGQIAHLDQNHENNAEDNLAFLCFDHHDEYDGTTRIAKGLRENEVRHWRDELYREMEYRFRTVKQRGFELAILRFRWYGPYHYFGKFQLTNTGEVAVRSPTISIRLPDNVEGELPIPKDEFGMPRNIEIWRTYEKELDIFERKGRVAIREMGGINPILMPGHAFEFDALMFDIRDYPEGTTIELEYRTDTEDSSPIAGKLSCVVPTFEDMIRAAATRQ